MDYKTAGELKRVIDKLPDDAPVFVNYDHRELGVHQIFSGGRSVTLFASRMEATDVIVEG